MHGSRRSRCSVCRCPGLQPVALTGKHLGEAVCCKHAGTDHGPLWQPPQRLLSISFSIRLWPSAKWDASVDQPPQLEAGNQAATVGAKVSVIKSIKHPVLGASGPSQYQCTTLTLLSRSRRAATPQAVIEKPLMENSSARSVSASIAGAVIAFHPYTPSLTDESAICLLPQCQCSFYIVPYKEHG